MITDIPRPKRRLKTWFWICALVAVGCGAFFSGLYLGHSGSTQAQTSLQAIVKNVHGIGTAAPADTVDKDLNFSQFWELWKMLKLKYYEDASDQKMLYGAMKGMAEAMGDPYTSFFEPTTAKEFSDSLKGEFEGIGAEIGIRNDQLQVIAPLPETPAARAGLMAGDWILAINGTSTEGMFTEEAVTLIRGKKGTDVTLKIARIKSKVKSTKSKVATSTALTLDDRDVKDVKITRDKITVKSVILTWPKDGIAMVQITNFNQDTDQEFSNAVDQVLAKGAKGVILDVRNDPGGYLDRATTIASAWVGTRTVVSERRKGKILDEFHGTGDARLDSIPTVVLVNQGSASASEIVAGALQDYGLAKLIGMKTFGKGSVQDYSEFDDGSAVKITIAEWLTPKGRSINKTGIKPDIEVDRTADDYNENRDPQLDKALEYLTHPGEPGDAAATSTKAK